MAMSDDRNQTALHSPCHARAARPVQTNGDLLVAELAWFAQESPQLDFSLALAAASASSKARVPYANELTASTCPAPAASSRIQGSKDREVGE